MSFLPAASLTLSSPSPSRRHTNCFHIWPHTTAPVLRPAGTDTGTVIICRREPFALGILEPSTRPSWTGEGSGGGEEPSELALGGSRAKEVEFQHMLGTPPSFPITEISVIIPIAQRRNYAPKRQSNLPKIRAGAWGRHLTPSRSLPPPPAAAPSGGMMGPFPSFGQASPLRQPLCTRMRRARDPERLPTRPGVLGGRQAGAGTAHQVRKTYERQTVPAGWGPEGNPVVLTVDPSP